MASRSQTTHHRHTLLLAALFLTLIVVVRAQDPAPPVASPLPPAGSKVLPAKGGPDVRMTSAIRPSRFRRWHKQRQGFAAKQRRTITLLIQFCRLRSSRIAVHSERDAEIGHTVGMLLQENHYLQRPIDAEMSQRWLKNYLKALDYNHLFFLQSDIDEFTNKYGNNLGDLLLHNNSEAAAVVPAFEIFNRYMQRLDENVVLAEKLLHDKYDFTKDETFTIRNNKSPWITDAAASEAIWRGQVKSDLLNGLLDKKAPDDTIKRLSKRYASLLREGTEEDDMDVVEMYFCALAHAYDPHSDYFQPDESQNFNILAIKHAVTGIGAVLRSEDGYAKIEEVIPGGPADLDKRLQPGDRIIAVGQGTDKPVDAVYMKLNRVVDR